MIDHVIKELRTSIGKKKKELRTSLSKKIHKSMIIYI